MPKTNKFNQVVSTVKNAFDKSLFSRSSYAQTVNKDTGAYRIEIIANGLDEFGLVGVLQEPISITMDPEWDVLNLASIVSNFPKLESLFNMAMVPAAAAGVSVNNAGLVTEKYFVKGSYVQIETTFKIVNWDNSAQPLKAAFLLMNLCTPTKMYGTTVGEVKNLLKEQLQNIGERVLGEKGTEKVGATLGGIADIVKDSFNTMESKLTKENPKIWKKGRKEINEGSFMLTNSPPDVYVRIGNYFEHPEMIVENVNVEFSKQMTKTGPLFANIKCTLSSKTMPVLGGEDKYSIGLKRNRKNITFETNEKINTL